MKRTERSASGGEGGVIALAGRWLSLRLISSSLEGGGGGGGGGTFVLFVIS